MLDIDTAGVIGMHLPRPLPPTLYARFGDWTVLLLIISSWGFFGLWVWRQRSVLKGKLT